MGAFLASMDQIPAPSIAGEPASREDDPEAKAAFRVMLFSATAGLAIG
jgi:hypothetical protein